MKKTSPFYVIEDFVSPLLCEELLEMCNFTVPNVDASGKNVVTITSNDRAEEIIYEQLQLHMHSIQAHYDIHYKGTEPILFEWYTEGCKGTMGVENSVFVRGKWLRTRSRDLSAILFLNDYQDEQEFDPEYEVYGGKLEFPQHHFGFNPQRGTLIVYPSDPHFINVTANVNAGSLVQARIHISAQSMYLYDPSKFPGNYLSWF
jgi:hypothetical protein